jgi:hypothetical protein
MDQYVTPPQRIAGDLRPRRDTRLDIMRGIMQAVIFASHTTGSFIGAWLIFGSWGLSDSSEQFVLFSGFMLGSVFARKRVREGWRAAFRDMLRRTGRLYLTQLALFVVYGATIVTVSLHLPDTPERPGWSFALEHPSQALPGVLTMLYQPEMMGILPMFIWCMLALPFYAALEARIGAFALAAPAALYAGVWLFGLATPSLSPTTGIAFEPLAWGLIFMIGATLGRRALLTGAAMPPWRWLTPCAIAILLAGLALRLSWYGFLPFHLPLAEAAWIHGKRDLALPCLLHALALAWLISVLIPRDAAWMHTKLAQAFAAMGRHSLHVFCVGLFLSWGAVMALRLLPPAFLL